MTKQPTVSVIVPTYNSSTNIKRFLESCTNSSEKNFEIIINDDLRTNDDTSEVVEAYAKRLNIVYIQENTSMAQARKAGVKYANSKILLHLDSDMEISTNLIYECSEKIKPGICDGLVIPEESFGTTFWAKCKWLEKKCYVGIEHIESLRCVSLNAYLKSGGHDKNMIFSEDKDLDIKVRGNAYNVGRTESQLMHNEGDLHLLQTLKKKANYTGTANLFAEKHPKEYAWQINILNRYIIFFKNLRYMLSNPLLYVGMIYMKTCEYAFAGYYMLRAKV